jgi:hypothetical protein
MITVRCPACGKVMGFEEADAGSLIACPLCRQSFFIPSVARPVAADGTSAGQEPAEPLVVPAPQEPALPDDIGLAADPELDAKAEREARQDLCDEVEPVEEVVRVSVTRANDDPEALAEVLPAEPEPLPESRPAPAPEAPPDAIPNLELDPPQTTGTPAEVKPTDLAPSLSAARVLAEALPAQEKAPEKPTERLEEVHDEREAEDRYRKTDEDEERDEREKEDEEEDDSRRRRRKRASRARTRHYDEAPRPVELTRNRILGGAGAGLGGLILLGTVVHHLTGGTSAWHPGVCCGDVFALALLGVGVFYLIRG